MPTMNLTLHRTYYMKGFFNVRVDFDRYVRSDDGPVKLVCGDHIQVAGRVTRTANLNGTARIFGGAALRDWFQMNFEQGETVKVDFVGLDRILLQVP